MRILGRRRRLRGLIADRRGVAAIEFALIASTLIFALLNTFDFARFFYEKMEVENVTQEAAQAAWKTCAPPQLPATTNCAGLNAAITASIQSSSLGGAIALAAGSPAEGYYCINGAGALVYVSAVASKPANCASVGNASGTPGDYITIQTTFTYAPIFGGMSLASTLPTPITDTALMRLQ